MARDDLSSSGDRERAAREERAHGEEEWRILLWRLEQFEDMGFSLPTAVALTCERIDLGFARKLIREGCPAAIAAQILL